MKHSFYIFRSLLIVLFGTSFYLTSCTCKKLVTCNMTRLGFVSIGYDTALLDSMVIISFSPDSRFDKPIDTEMTGVGFSQIISDTVTLNQFINYPTSDYEVIFPKAGVTLRISQLTWQGNATQDLKIDCAEQQNPQCYRLLNSYNVNGQTISGQSSEFLEYYTFIK